MFVVRKDLHQKSETISKAENAPRAIQEAMTVLMESDRDYELFYCVELDSRGRFLRDVESVSWEPRG